MVIQITDPSTNMTAISAGGAVRFAQIKSAVQIIGWIETRAVPRPFKVGGGECLFDTDSLFCFDGGKNLARNNVLMVLWDFPLHPTVPTSGQGQLNSPPSAGFMVDGLIDWEITHL